jgi:hypothetical protein
MTTGQNDSTGAQLRQQLVPLADAMFCATDEQRFADGKNLFAAARSKLEEARGAAAPEIETVLNELYVLGAYFRLLARYAEVWEHIINQRFASSWVSLQDALDSLRAIKLLSAIDVGYFEMQLTNLEEAYPYRVFFSIGAVASRIECSICGKDIDSLECAHRRGQLYAGEMACGIIRAFTRLDHVSMVTNPDDKRCVVEIPDASEQFKLLRYLSALVREQKLRISEFERIRFSKRRVPNPAFRKVGRNDPCFCGSGRKFKTCCIDKMHVEGDHADVCAKSTPKFRANLTEIAQSSSGTPS